MATRLKPFRITPAEPELTLILLANIHHAKEQDWGQEFRAAMSAIPKKYSYNHVHDATSMAYILKELAGADKLQAIKLAPAPNSNKANAVGKYRFILQHPNDSWDGESSYANLSSYNGSDSSEEKSLSVKNHRNKKRSGKSSRSSKRSNLRSSNSSSKEELKPKKKAAEVVTTCKYCKKYGKSQHPKRFSINQCTWNKKAVCFRYAIVCKQMGLKMWTGRSSKREKKTNSQSTKPRHQRRKTTTTIDGVGDMETIMSNMTANVLR